MKEIKNYRWKKDPKTDEILDEPVKYKDDGMDASAYSCGDIIRDEKLFEKWINDPIDDRRERQIKRQAVAEYDVLNY